MTRNSSLTPKSHEMWVAAGRWWWKCVLEFKSFEFTSRTMGSVYYFRKHSWLFSLILKKPRRDDDCNNAPQEISEPDFRLEGDVRFWFQKGFSLFDKKLHLQRICVSNVVRHFEQHPQPVNGRKQTLYRTQLWQAQLPRRIPLQLRRCRQPRWSTEPIPKLWVNVNNLHTKTC